MNSKKKPGNLVRINTKTTGSPYISFDACVKKVYPKIDKGELGIYLKHFEQVEYYVVYIFSKNERLGFCPEEVDFL